MAKLLIVAVTVLVVASGNAQVLLQGTADRKHHEREAQRLAAREAIVRVLRTVEQRYKDFMHDSTLDYEKMAGSIDARFAEIKSCKEATLEGAIKMYRKNADRSTYPDFAVELLLHYAYQLNVELEGPWPFYVRGLDEWPITAFRFSNRHTPWAGAMGNRHLQPFFFFVGPTGYPYGLDEKLEYIHKNGTYLLSK